MNKKTLTLMAVGFVLIFGLSAAISYHLAIKDTAIIRVACVGDSLTQSSEYPYDLWLLLGNESYTLRNYGAGSTTISLSSETPYMNTTVYKDALEFQPNVVIIMLGTNDAQPPLHRYNSSLVDDYAKLIAPFTELSSKPEVWVVFPPPIFSNEPSKIDPEYFKLTIIPSIQQVASQTNVQTVDVFSVLDSPNYFLPDGVHINSEGAKLIADTIFKAIFQ